MKKIHVDKDITQAATLPSFFYTDPTLFIETKEKLFEKSWQWVGDLNSLFPLRTMSIHSVYCPHC